MHLHYFQGLANCINGLHVQWLGNKLNYLKYLQSRSKQSKQKQK